MTFAVIRPDFVSMLKQNDCEETVSRPANMVPVPTDEQVLLTETSFTEIEPTRQEMIINKLIIYDQLIIAHRDEALQEVNAANMAAARAEQIRTINSTYRNRVFDKLKLQSEYERSFMSAHSDWETHKIRLSTKSANCAKVFALVFSPSALGSAREFVERGEFRRAFYELDRQYSSESASIETQGVYIKMLNNLKFSGTDMPGHLNTFYILVNQVTQAGHTLFDPTKYQLLAESVTKGSNRDYDDVIKYSVNVRPRETFGVLHDRLKDRHSTIALEAIPGSAEKDKPVPNKLDETDLTAKEFKDSINNILSSSPHLKQTLINQAKLYQNNNSNNNSNNNNNRNNNTNNNRNNVTVTCSHCNQPGHSEARCWGKIPCFNCGVTAVGHNSHFCAQNQSASRVSDSTGNDNGTKVELLSNFQKK